METLPQGNNEAQPASGPPRFISTPSQRVLDEELMRYLGTQSDRRELHNQQNATEGEGRGSYTADSTALPRMKIPAQEPSSVDAIQNSLTSPAMQLELPSSNTDDAPIPPAQAAVAYEEMEEEIKSLMKNSSISDNAPPVPPGQIAASFEDMENGIKGFLKDDTPPLQDSQIATVYEETEDDKKGMKMKPQTLEEGEIPMPATPPQEVIHDRSPIDPPVSSRPPTGQATSTENNMTQQRRGQRQRQAALAAVIHRSPQSTVAPLNDDETSTPPIPMFHEVEATLVLNEPVYDAVQIQDDDNKPQPWWKKHQQYIWGGMGLFIIGLLVVVGVSFNKNNGVNDESDEESVVYVVASTPPSQSLTPSSSPSMIPSSLLDKWTLVADQNTTWWANETNDEDANFRSLIDAGCRTENDSLRSCIIRRICGDSCNDSHKNIYYKRLTKLPEENEVRFLDFFLINWFSSPANTLDIDFELYSSYEDALANNNKWVFCNYNDPGVGFPRDCGPRGYVACQWNSYTRGGLHEFAFYVENP